MRVEGLSVRIRILNNALTELLAHLAAAGLCSLGLISLLSSYSFWPHTLPGSAISKRSLC